MQRKEGPHIDSLRDIQTIEASFSSLLSPCEKPEDILSMIDEEIDELKDSVMNGGRKEIAAEAADVLILLAKLATFYSIPLDEAVSAKLNRNYHKYSPYKTKMLVEQGMPLDEICLFLKGKWDKSMDEEFHIF